MKVIAISTILFLFLLILSCTTISKKKNFFNFKNKEVKVVKFMGIDHYATEINEKVFWLYPEEHAYVFMDAGGFLDEVKKFEQINNDSIREPAYAFIYDTDTLYTDWRLKYWTLKNNKKHVYYKETTENVSNSLKTNHPFFRDCW